MNVEGILKIKGETQEFGSKGFTKRQSVITTDEKYPQDIAIDFVQDATDLLDPFEVGQSVKVAINLRGNEYNGKYYVNLQGWKIEALEGGTQTQQTPPQNNDADPDDLPF